MSKKVYKFVVVVLSILMLNMIIILPSLGDEQPGYTIGMGHMFTGVVIMLVWFSVGMYVGGSDD